MLTLFSIPKPFRGHSAVIQRNAIRSWAELRPQPEVILFGQDEGVAETARELNIKHIPEIDCSEQGTPLVSSLFAKAREAAGNATLCYVNSDIILLDDFMPSVSRIQKPPFLIVGRRWDLDIDYPLEFADRDWEKRLRELAAHKAKLHSSSGIDYFVFPRDFYQDIPPFAIGRGSWDNWFLCQARKLDAPIIDATAVITAIHENHDYSHLKDGTDHFSKGPEAKANLEMAGGVNCLFSLDYATRFLTAGGLRSSLSPRHLYFRLRGAIMLNSHLHFLLTPLNLLQKAVALFK